MFSSQSRNKNSFFKKVNIWKLSFYISKTKFVSFFTCNGFLFVSFFQQFLKIFILMVIISLELTRVNPNRSIHFLNWELTSTLITLLGLILHHLQILKYFCFNSYRFSGALMNWNTSDLLLKRFWKTTINLFLAGDFSPTFIQNHRQFKILY